MKNHELKKIANMTGYSKSTVSKALNHCFGVERASREIILEAARTEGIAANGRCDVYGILPDYPLKFWTQVLGCFEELYSSDICCKFNICAYNSETMLTGYLEEALWLGAKLLLMGGCPDEALMRRFSEKIPVFFLFASPSIVNTFSFSGSPYAEGEVLRQRALLHDKSKVLVLDDGSWFASERARGFAADAIHVRTLALPDSAMSAANLARYLHEAHAETPDIIYTLAGPIREAALAATKLGLREVTVIGHDQTGEYMIGCVKCIGFSQDVTAVCEAASDAAIEYIEKRCFPNVKHTVIGL